MHDRVSITVDRLPVIVAIIGGADQIVATVVREAGAVVRRLRLVHRRVIASNGVRRVILH